MGIQHIFMLMLENRSFDHMLGRIGLRGIDAENGSSTGISGLLDLSMVQLARSLGVKSASAMVTSKGQPWPPPAPVSIRDLFTANVYNGVTYRTTQPADWAMPADPCHEFQCAVEQLCGAGMVYTPGAPYPRITNSGFVANYATKGGDNATESSAAAANPGEIMMGYAREQLPVLVALCEEFVVCDHWYSSMPGPTWPNRFFAHAASAGGLDYSPSTAQMVSWETIDGFEFSNGTIFDALSRNHLEWRIYAGDDFPIVAGLKGIQLTDIHGYGDFAADLAKPSYTPAYTFIEPSYDALSAYRCGTSQHPLSDVTRGESLIKATYEAIRNSPVWNNSLLILTWDESGGFYDHVAPPHAVPPGDTPSSDAGHTNGFAFDQYGARVPAVIVSPLIPRNLIDHRPYDHASIPATLETCFGLSALTQRDLHANNLMSLVSSTPARGDTPSTLPAPAMSNVVGCGPVAFKSKAPLAKGPPVRPGDSIDGGNIPGLLYVALRMELQASSPADRDQILVRFNSVRTRADAVVYFERVANLTRPLKPHAL